MVGDRHPRERRRAWRSTERQAATIHEHLATEARPAAVDRGWLAGKIAVMTGASSGIGRAAMGASLTRGPRWSVRRAESTLKEARRMLGLLES